MSQIDRQRIAAVQTLELLGYRFDKGEWTKSGVPVAASAANEKLTSALGLIQAIRDVHFDQRVGNPWMKNSVFEQETRRILGLP